jgi:hypothetical protein
MADVAKMPRVVNRNLRFFINDSFGVLSIKSVGIENLARNAVKIFQKKCSTSCNYLKYKLI